MRLLYSTIVTILLALHPALLGPAPELHLQGVGGQAGVGGSAGFGGGISPPAVPTFINSYANTSAMNFGAGTITLTTPATAGQAVLVDFYCTNGACGTTTVVDNNSNSLTGYSGCTITGAAGSPMYGGAPGGYVLRFAYVVPSAQTASTLTFAFSGSYSQAIATVVSNLPTPACQAAGADGFGGSSDLNPTSTATPTASPGYATAVYIANASTCTAGGGWTTGAASTTNIYVYVFGKATSGLGAVTSAGTCTYAPSATIAIW